MWILKMCLNLEFPELYKEKRWSRKLSGTQNFKRLRAMNTRGVLTLLFVLIAFSAIAVQEINGKRRWNQDPVDIGPVNCICNRPPCPCDPRDNPLREIMLRRK